jgi:hypothetical protein
MKRFIEGEYRNQNTLFPECLEDSGSHRLLDASHGSAPPTPAPDDQVLSGGRRSEIP